MSFSIIISVGKYGGIYFTRSNSNMRKGFRLCLGWIAFDYMTPELDKYLDKVMETFEIILADARDCIV